MDDIARLPFTDRMDLFSATSRRRGLTAEIIEKDFWVCWTFKPPLNAVLFTESLEQTPNVRRTNSGK